MKVSRSSVYAAETVKKRGISQLVNALAAGKVSVAARNCAAGAQAACRGLAGRWTPYRATKALVGETRGMKIDAREFPNSRPLCRRRPGEPWPSQDLRSGLINLVGRLVVDQGIAYGRLNRGFYLLGLRQDLRRGYLGTLFHYQAWTDCFS